MADRRVPRLAPMAEPVVEAPRRAGLPLRREAAPCPR